MHTPTFTGTVLTFSLQTSWSALRKRCFYLGKTVKKLSYRKGFSAQLLAFRTLLSFGLKVDSSKNLSYCISTASCPFFTGLFNQENYWAQMNSWTRSCCKILRRVADSTFLLFLALTHTQFNKSLCVNVRCWLKCQKIILQVGFSIRQPGLKWRQCSPCAGAGFFHWAWY